MNDNFAVISKSKDSLRENIQSKVQEINKEGENINMDIFFHKIPTIDLSDNINDKDDILSSLSEDNLFLNSSDWKILEKKLQIEDKILSFLCPSTATASR